MFCIWWFGNSIYRRLVAENFITNYPIIRRPHRPNFFLHRVIHKSIYNYIIMTIEAWVGTIVGISAIISSAGLGVRWLVKHYFDEIKHELKPNSGSSLKDQVTRLEREISEAELKRNQMSEKLDHMYDILLDYISRNNQAPETKKSRSKNS